MKPALKYAHFFVKNPKPIVEAARQASEQAWSQRYSSQRRKYLKEAHALLSALGVSDRYMRQAIIQGHADVQSDDDGWLYYIDHRVTKEVMERITLK